jgi:CheY-like chemotaxis protein
MLRFLKQHLQNAGFSVLLAEDWIVGGHLVLNAAPDLILVDVQMPYLSGYELVDALKGDPVTRHIPVLFLTADKQVEERTRQLGAEAYA